MKKTISITVDLDNLMVAKEKVNNISEYLNDCLGSLTSSNDNSELSSIQNLRNDLQDLNSQINDMIVRRNILQMNLKRAEEEESERIVARQREEFNKRWICPVCVKRGSRVLNLMDDRACKSCGLNARDSNKTEIVIEDHISKEVL